MHVEYHYCFDPSKPNPYHTSVHAADVTLTVAHFCENQVRHLQLSSVFGQNFPPL